MAGYVLTIQLEDTNIWRQVMVPQQLTFHQLHQTIQLCMGWKDCHLYTFKPVHTPFLFVATQQECEEYEAMQNSRATYLWQQGRPMNASQLIEYRVAKTTTIDDFLIQDQEIIYRYDMGDDWQHSIRVDRIETTYEKNHPTLLTGHGNCPPEDCGGVPGYMYLCTVLADAKHPEHEAYRNWLGNYENESVFDLAKINEKLIQTLQFNLVIKST